MFRKVIANIVCAGFLVFAFSAELLSEAIVEEKKESEEGLGFGGIPVLTFSSDAGVGFGLAGSMYKKSAIFKPYRYSLDVLLYMTTRSQHSHSLTIDALDVFGAPLRVFGKLGFFATRNQNYCGMGGRADCDKAPANAVADNLGLSGEIREDFIWRYFRMRYFDIYGVAYGRWRFRDLPHKVELIFGWRGDYYRPGDFDTEGQYAKSLYAADFGLAGEKGFTSLLEAGLSFDNRDNEPAPTSGYWIEATIRGGSPIWGSNWTFGGIHFSARTYVPLESSHKLVFANRFLVDAIFGDPPLYDIVRVGGSAGTLNQTAFGGQYIGRGLREQYFPGRIKFIDQLELRYNFLDFGLLGQNFEVGATGFLDAGVVAWDFDKLVQEPEPVAIGFGAGLRLNWNKTFVIRVDFALSHFEDYELQYYITLANAF